MNLPLPDVPFNPVAVDAELTPAELIAGPFGLLLFLPFIPIVRWLARWQRPFALLAPTAVWLFWTLGPAGLLVFVGGTLLAAGYVALLTRWRAAGHLSCGGMIAGVWIGLNLLALPLWWQANWWWYGWEPGGARIATFHPIGFAYLLLRLIAWGVDSAKQPQRPLRPLETLCWLFYPPGLRNGPFLLRERFLERYDTWNPRDRVPWLAAGGHVVAGLLAFGLLGIAANNLPNVQPGASFFAQPDNYSTGELIRFFYLVPAIVYLFLWGYNEVALGAGMAIGIRMDSNFAYLPLATSVRDFWRRWNLNVGAWIRDYIYIPLGGNRGNPWLVYAAAFGYCGVWHGAAWGMAAWPIVPVVALTVQRHWDAYRRARGWEQRPSSALWISFCRVLTLHLGWLTVFIFTDFHHAGTRFFPELIARLTGLF